MAALTSGTGPVPGSAAGLAAVCDTCWRSETARFIRRSSLSRSSNTKPVLKVASGPGEIELITEGWGWLQCAPPSEAVDAAHKGSVKVTFMEASCLTASSSLMLPARYPLSSDPTCCFRTSSSVAEADEFCVHRVLVSSRNALSCTSTADRWSCSATCSLPVKSATASSAALLLSSCCVACCSNCILTSTSSACACAALAICPSTCSFKAATCSSAASAFFSCSCSCSRARDRSLFDWTARV
mmetsp:Transcript_16027/g.34637  ORF Transcript_16027/g.34637 Transcript_16027/m.34637 type:complete len:242 (-) Transcript_16027:1061-1786(-)